MIGDYITRHPVDHKSLNLPQAPHHNPRFLDVVTMSIYEGEVADGLTVKSSVDNARHEPLRAAIEGLYKEAGFAEIIEAALKKNLSALYLPMHRVRLIRNSYQSITGFRPVCGRRSVPVRCMAAGEHWHMWSFAEH